MKDFVHFMIFGLLFFNASLLFSQQIKFNRVANQASKWGTITGIAQDHQGYIWFSSGTGGLNRYDGNDFLSYKNDPRNPNSLVNNRTECILVDSLNNIWVGTIGYGLDKFDPITNTFLHFRHNSQDNGSLGNDTVTALLQDHLGNIWVGTYSGLNLFNKSTGKFIHYSNKPDDIQSLSNNHVRTLYEDHNGDLWIGCGSPWANEGEKPEDGGLNTFIRTNGKFTRYIFDSANPSSLANNKVSAIFEDSQGKFWVGTAGDGLQILDRAKGTFTHYYYDPLHPEKLSRPPLNDLPEVSDYITFINEDAKGAIWIGSFASGINRYDPVIKKTTHYGYVLKGENSILQTDTSEGYRDFISWKGFSSKDGLFWICTFNGSLYRVNLFKTTLPFYSMKQTESNSLYCESNNNILWIATDDGLLRKNLLTQSEKLWVHDSLNDNSLSSNPIYGMEGDDEGKIWLGTVGGGLDKFDPLTEKFTHYRHDSKNPKSICSDVILNLFIDHNNNVWVATDSGIAKLDKKTGLFLNYKHLNNDSTRKIGFVYCVTEDKDHSIWVGMNQGVCRLDTKTGKFRQYPMSSIKSVCVDSKGDVWAGGTDGLFYFNREKDQFSLYENESSPIEISGVLGILEDDDKNIWVSTSEAIVKILPDRKNAKKYSEAYGVHYNAMGWCMNFKGRNGKLFLADVRGYYSFYPNEIKDYNIPPQVNFTGFKLGDQEIKPSKNSVLNAPLWQATEIKLNYYQNVFSFDFIGIQYNTSGDEKYLFMLENYDNAWHNIGSDHKAYFFNVPPGNYVFHARAVNSDGIWGEKTISIIITPPWWQTWWAYTIFALLFICAIWAIIAYRSRRLQKENKILEEKVINRTAQLNKSIEDLKATQTQLIQSEKMASLGELTAGIAHEIQNPLNFVNNFSEVNKELVDELQTEAEKGNIDEVKVIARNIRDNEEKILHHGKRADAIVKGMLQHSRKSTGHKEPTDINALADEYLRLSYHGVRAKDNSFTATLKTEFDNAIEKINVVPQDIGRVLLNLYNNAFYALNEKRNQLDSTYEPSVSVSTKKIDHKIEVHIKDNGNGIPSSIKDKIFQPFFTTKPTGQGTGLGLSLSYDIVKAHGGEIKVETKEGEGSEFVILLLTEKT